jgi:hypothetical protein
MDVMTFKKFGAGVIALLALSQIAMADDMESMFDDANGGKKPKSSSEKTSTVSPLFYILQTQIKNPTPDQSVFVRYIEADEWDKALLQFPVAFEGTPFQKSPNGRALWALAHFKAGLPVTGLELLFKNVEKPGDVHAEIRTMWKNAAPAGHPAWDLAAIKWRPAFAEIFSPEAAFKAEVRDLASIKDTKTLDALYAKLPTGSMERSRVGWQLVIAHSIKNEVEDAAKTLAQLMKTEPLPVSRDLMELTAARLLFQRGHFSAAVKYYEKVGRDSEYWPDAQEEMAWSYVRRGEPNNSLAISKSLVVPAFAVQSGAEGFFVYSLSLLKMCDYPGVITSLGDFPKVFKPRVAQLERLAASSEIPEAKKLIDLLKKKRITRAELGKESQALPRMVARDDRLFDYAQAQKNLEIEAHNAEVIYSRSLALTGLQGYFDTLKKTADIRAHAAAAASNGRIQVLAKQEIGEIKEILRKLHIVEAEVIQQVSIAERIAQNTKGGPVNEQKGVTGSKAQDTLKFPAEKEVWFDEIGNYRVNVKKSCQAGGRKEKST